MKSLEGKVALITGAATGIGRGIARRFVREGARVLLMDISQEALEALVTELGPSSIGVVGDVGSWADNQTAVARALEHFGQLDILIANAGIYDHAVALKDLPGESISAAFDELFGVNVKGCLLSVRASLSALLATKGNIVFTGSFASFSPAGGGALYTASKHAVVGLVRQLAYELAPNIRVNAVAPGVAPTVLKGVKSLGQTAKNAVLEGTAANVPLQFVPDADDYGGLYAFLASSAESAHITGSVFNADSGLSIRGFNR